MVRQTSLSIKPDLSKFINKCLEEVNEGSTDENPDNMSRPPFEVEVEGATADQRKTERKRKGKQKNMNYN